MADDWGSIGGTVASAAPGAQKGGDDWGSIGGTVANAAPGAGVTPATSDEKAQFSWNLPKAMNGVSRDAPGYQKAMAYYVRERPELFAGYGQKGNPGRGDAGVQSFLEQASGGLADEGEAQLERGATALAQMFGAKQGFSPDEAYQAKKDLAQMARQVRERKYPLTTFTGGAAGAVVPWLTGGGEAEAVASAPSLAQRAAQVGKVALGSAAQAGATTFNESEGSLGDRAAESAGSAAVGGALGAAGEATAQALPFAWRAGRRIVAKAADYLSDSPMGAGWNPANASAQAGARISGAGLTPGDFRGDPTALAGRLKQNLDDLEALHDGQVSAAQAKAQGLAPDPGAVPEADDRGEAIRSAVDAQRQARYTAAKAPYEAVDEANPTANVVDTKQAAKAILEKVPNLGNGLGEAEGRFLNQAAGMDDVVPWSDLQALKSDVGARIRAKAAKGEFDTEYNRLNAIRDAIHTNMATTISDRVAQDAQAVAEGRMAQGDALGERMAQAATGTDSGQPVPTAGEMDPRARQQIGQAQADVAQWRAGPGRAENLLAAIRQLGGVQLRKPNGVMVDGAPEIADALGGKPFVVNNQGGMTPDGLREALAEKGWFGGDNAGSIAQGDNSLSEMIRRDIASGGKVFHPDSDMPARLAAHDSLSDEMARAGVADGDRADVAARKLALYRAAQEAADTNQLRLMARLRAEADRLGVSHGPETSYDQLLHDVTERHAIQSEGLSEEEKAAYEAAIDHGLGPDEFERQTDHAFGGAPDPSAQAGAPAEAGGGGDDAGGQEAPEQSGGGDGASGANGRPGGGAEVAQPTMTPELRDTLKQGDALWRDYKRTFASGPVGRILARDAQGLPRLRDGKVPEQFFRPNDPTSFQNLNDLKGVVGEDAYNSIVTHEAVASLQKSGAIRPDGTVDPAKFETWKTRYRDAIRGLPDGVLDSFSSAAKATEALDDAGAARADALKEAQAGAIGKIMGMDNAEDIKGAVGRIFSGQESVAKMAALAKATKGDPAATAGLQRAVLENMADMLGSRGARLATFLKANREALSQVFSPRQIAGFESLAAAASKGGEAASLGDIIAEHGPDAAIHMLATKLGGPVGLVGSLIGRKAISALTRNGVRTVNDLVVEGLRNPDFASELVGAARRVKAQRAARDSAIEDMTTAVRFNRALGGANTAARAGSQAIATP